MAFTYLSRIHCRILSSVTDGGAAQLLPAAEAYHLSQTRHKVTGKTTTKSQRFQLAIKPQEGSAHKVHA